MTPNAARQWDAPARGRTRVAAMALALMAFTLSGCVMETGSDDVPSEPASAKARLLHAARTPGVQWQLLHLGPAAAQRLTSSKDEHGNVLSLCKSANENPESSKP